MDGDIEDQIEMCGESDLCKYLKSDVFWHKLYTGQAMAAFIARDRGYEEDQIAEAALMQANAMISEQRSMDGAAAALKGRREAEREG